LVVLLLSDLGVALCCNQTIQKMNTETASRSNEVIGYKGFDANLKCRDMQYVIGETHEMPKDKILSLCPENENEGGLHFCENPLDVFRYYEPAISRFAEVKSVGDVKRKSDDSDTKIATTKLHVSVELSLHSLIERGVKFIFERTTLTKEATNTEKQKQAINSGDRGAASNSGNRGAAANSGYRGAAANSGDRGAASNSGNGGAAANSGDRGAAANSGDRGAASNSGDRGAASNSGDRGAASNSGDSGAASNSGNSGAASNSGNSGTASNSGDRGAASNSGHSGAASNSGHSGAAMSIGGWSKAETSVANSFACALGIESKAKGALNSWIVISEWKETEKSWVISDAKCFKVDGIEILADTFYILKNGKPCILG